MVTGVVIERAQLRQHLLQQPRVEQHPWTVHTELQQRGWARSARIHAACKAGVGVKYAAACVCRSPECCRLSGAGEHAYPDRHRGQHLCSRRRRGLSYGHSQVEPPRSRPRGVLKQAGKTIRRRQKCPKFRLNVFFSFSGVSVLGLLGWGRAIFPLFPTDPAVQTSRSHTS